MVSDAMLNRRADTHHSSTSAAAGTAVGESSLSVQVDGVRGGYLRRT